MNRLHLLDRRIADAWPRLATDTDLHAFEAVPYAYFGQFSPAYAARKSLKHLDQYWNIPTLWVLDK